LAVAVTYGSLLCVFAGEFTAIKAVCHGFSISAIADLAKLVFSC